MPLENSFQKGYKVSARFVYTKRQHPFYTEYISYIEKGPQTFFSLNRNDNPPPHYKKGGGWGYQWYEIKICESNHKNSKAEKNTQKFSQLRFEWKDAQSSIYNYRIALLLNMNTLTHWKKL